MELALMIAHVVFSVILIIVVLLQRSKQAGLSGAVGGANETFFGKNKGRTVDSILKKLTAVFAVLFVITSVSLAIVSTRPEETPETNVQNLNVEGEAPVAEEVPADAENSEGETEEPVEGETEAEAE